MIRDNHSGDMDEQREELLNLILSRPRRSTEEKLRWLEEIKQRAAAEEAPPATPEPMCPPTQGGEHMGKELPGGVNWDPFRSVGTELWQAVTTANTMRTEAEQYATTIRRAADSYASQVRREADQYARDVVAQAEEQAAVTIARAEAYEDQALEGAARIQQRARLEAEDALHAAQAEAKNITAVAQRLQTRWSAAFADWPTDSGLLHPPKAAFLDEPLGRATEEMFRLFAEIGERALHQAWIASDLPDGGCDLVGAQPGALHLFQAKWRFQQATEIAEMGVGREHLVLSDVAGAVRVVQAQWHLPRAVEFAEALEALKCVERSQLPEHDEQPGDCYRGLAAFGARCDENTAGLRVLMLRSGEVAQAIDLEAVQVPSPAELALPVKGVLALSACMPASTPLVVLEGELADHETETTSAR